VQSTRLEFIHLAGPSFEEVARREGADFVGARLNFSPTDFARTIAKIAFSAAVRSIGIKAFTYTPIRRVILGEDAAVGRWVGSWSGQPVNNGPGLHQLKIQARGTSIEVVVRLFAQFGAPEYHVVLGPADPAFVDSAAWPWRATSS
jgi:hypothetical protein